MTFHNLKKCVLFGLGLMPIFVLANINPLDLDALLLRATQTHPLVNAAKADEMAAAEGVRAAKLGMLPTPTISTGHDKNDGLVSTVAIRQPLWTGGRLTAQINQSIYDNKAANAYVFEQQNTVAKNTIDIWRGYIYAVALQELYADSLARLKEFEAMMERRVAQGVSAKIELDLVKNRIYQDQNSLQNAIEQERVAAARLSQLIGEELGDKKYNITMKSLTDYAKAQSVNFETQVFGNVGSHHPSVVRQHFQVEAAKQEAKAQAAGRYPNIYAQYQHTFEHENNEDDGEFSVGMSYDPGAGFSSLALTRAANARAMSLTQTQEATRRTVMESLQTQYQEFVSSRDREQSIKLAIDGAKLVVDSYGRQFIAGRKSWLEVLNAVREHTQYEQQLLEVQSQMVASFYKLQVDFGAMDWQSDYHVIHTPVSEFRPYRTFLAWRETNAQPAPKLSTPMVDDSFVNQQDLWIEPPRLADEMGNEMDEIDEIHSSDAQMEHIIDGEGVQMGEQIQPVDERRFPTADDFKQTNQ
ncbi:TolC family protein [Moraxella lacunata]|uniref:Type I secretion outer membrane protein, TolC family n=1 Tax=Moraxella lacunata TaxID=477 RepID=A0A1B8Q2J1_MORLA|nr:TolC family protein [Moraxella lacunata]MDI4481962.1 TolC family protein [Moraxella lacunata]MDI4506621.1 TolC family protein [Moraxella lacunata]OBX63127.1 hypothetical protein A9309_06380 [Moraxella lacunata]OBX64201.1 hypothetical protein A9Z63_04070 [Moraxella lacunata]